MEHSISRILVAFDHSAAAAVALKKGIEIARMYGAALHVVFVEADEKTFDYETITAYLEEETRGSGIAMELHHRRGKAFREIVQCEKEIQADLLLLGTHGVEGFIPFWLGSTAFRVASSSDCPVITVPETARNLDFKQIVMPLDSTPETRQKMGYTAMLAKKFGSSVHVLCVSKDNDHETEHYLSVYRKQAEEFFTNRGIPYTCEMITGVNIAQTTIDVANKKEAGLVVMMTETEPAGFFMGSVAQQLINHCPVPVMAIRAKHVMVAGGGL
jgi:nucleotide-binding universal stress UspA family protein